MQAKQTPNENPRPQGFRENEDGLFFTQPMPDAQNHALQHSLTNTIPNLLFNLRASAARVVKPIATDSARELSAGSRDSAVGCQAFIDLQDMAPFGDGGRAEVIEIIDRSAVVAL